MTALTTQALFTNQRKAFLFAAALLVLLLSPNFMIAVLHPQEIWRASTLIGIAYTLLIVLWMSFLINRAWMFFACCALFYLLAPFELFHMYVFSTRSNELTVGVLVETNFSEASEFMNMYLWPMIFLSVIFTAFYLYCLFKLRQYEGRGFFKRLYEKIGINRRGRNLLAVAGFILFLLNTGLNFSAPSLAKKLEIGIVKTYPLGVPYRISHFLNETRKIMSYRKKSLNFKFGAYSKNPQKQLCVVVIGESSRFDHWSLGGYARETNPQLKKIKNLTLFTNMLSSSIVTRFSVPILLTRAKAEDFQLAYQEKSFLTAFQEAGFKTYWLSNQSPVGFYDNLVVAYAKDADKKIYLSDAGPYATQPHDDVLLSLASNILNRDENKVLIVLHAIGSHQDYHRRYPPSFDHFKPSLQKFHGSLFNKKSEKRLVVNAYDNSILFTDYFLSKLIELVDSAKRLSSVVFVPDHGENLYDEGRDYAGHGVSYDDFPLRHEVHVPMLVWFSEKFISAYPSKAKAVQSNKDKKINFENFFYSLLDLADIGYDGEDLSRSVFNDQLVERPRKVLLLAEALAQGDQEQLRLVDYD